MHYIIRVVSYIADTEVKRRLFDQDSQYREKLFSRPTGKTKLKDPTKYFHSVAGTFPMKSSHKETKHSLWD